MKFCMCILCIGILTGCAPGPKYERPETAVEGLKTYKNNQSVSSVVESEDFSRWWKNMKDPYMDLYVRKLLDSNLQLREAAERIDQARARLKIAGAGNMPSLSFSASASRSRQPLNGGSFSAIPGLSGTHINSTQVETGVTANWVPDLFGKRKRGISSARFQYLASMARAEGLINSLVAELARGRVALSTLKRSLELGRYIAESRKNTLESIERRYMNGDERISSSDVYLARQQLASAEADLLNTENLLEERAYAQDILLGLPPGSTDPFNADIPLLPPPESIETGIPLELLDRRPDLRATELGLMSAGEAVGVAVADLYPGFTLGGSAGFQNNELSGLFESGNLAASILADVMLRLFEGGRLRSTIDLREAEAREQAAVYAGRVLNALKEVESALKNEKYLKEKIDRLEIRLINSRESEKLALKRYELGLLSYLDLLDIQRMRYGAEQEYLMACRDAWNNRIALYLALGGDWL